MLKELSNAQGVVECKTNPDSSVFMVFLQQVLIIQI